MMVATILFLFIAVADGLTVTQTKTIHKNIVGGSPLTNNHPYIHEVSLKRIGAHICGGSIITPRVVLTAAHCVYKREMWQFIVEVGITHVLEYGGRYYLKTMLPHPMYNPTTVIHDIAILEVREPITYGPRVGAIPIYHGFVPVGSAVTTTGWGHQCFNGTITDILQELNTTVISADLCTEVQPYKKPAINDLTQICVYRDFGMGVCCGDSGGPLIYKGQLIGLTSWGRECAVGYPDVFTRVYGYIDWINDYIKNNSM